MPLKCRVSYPAADGCLGERVGDRRERAGRGGGRAREGSTEFHVHGVKAVGWKIGATGAVDGDRRRGPRVEGEARRGPPGQPPPGLSWWADVAPLSESATLLNSAFPLPS